MDVDGVSVGARLRALRRARRMTLRAVAEQAGISEPHLSLIEREKKNASIGTLRRVAGALGLTMADLFDGEADRPRLLRAGDRPHLAFGVLGTKYRLTLAPDRQMDAFLGEFQPHGSTGEDAYAHGDSEELLLILTGRMRLELDGESFELGTGDSIVYRSTRRHKLTEIDGRPATALWVMTPPSY